MKKKVEVLYFEGCPNHEGAVALVRETARELGLDIELEEVEVKTGEDAERLRFLGSPSIRVDERDVEPAARESTAYAFACRIYGSAGLPQRQLVQAALNGELPPDVTPESGRWVGGAAAAAVLASVCCLGPVVLAGVGISAAGVSALFAPLRPLFLVVTAALLAGAFYVSYFRKPVCAPGTTCATQDAGRVRRTRAVLWLSTVAVVLVALYPVYGGAILRAGSTQEAAAGSPRGERVHLLVDGMTCETCAVGIEKNLAAVPGVVSASVSYADGEATITTDQDDPPSTEALLEAVKSGGYEARVATGGKEDAP